MYNNHNSGPSAEMIMPAVLSVGLFCAGFAMTEPAYHLYPMRVTIEPSQTKVIFSDSSNGSFNWMDPAARIAKIDLGSGDASVGDPSAVVAVGFNSAAVLWARDFGFDHSLGTADLTSHSFSDIDFFSRGAGMNANVEMPSSSHKYHLYDRLPLISININDLLELDHGHQKTLNEKPDSIRSEDTYRQGNALVHTLISFAEPSTLLVGAGIAGGSIAKEKT